MLPPSPRLRLPPTLPFLLTLALLSITSAPLLPRGSASPASARILEATFDVHSVDTTWFPESKSDPLTAEARQVVNLKPHEQHFEVAILNVFFDQPMFINENVSLADLQHFLQLHRSHRQVLYGLTRLDCPHGTVPSYPAKGNRFAPDGSALPPHLLFPLPSTTDSEFKWLNTLSGHFAYGARQSPATQLNRLGLGLVLSYQDIDGHGKQYVTAEQLPACELRFLPPSEQHWRPVVNLTTVSGVPFRGAARLTSGNATHKHFHHVSRGISRKTPLDQMFTTFLETGAMTKMIAPLIEPIAASQLNHRLQQIIDYVIAALNNEGLAKTMGYITGRDSPGAMPAMAGSIFLQTSETIGAAPPKDIIDGKMTKNLITTLIHDLTTLISMRLTQTLTDAVHANVHDMLMDSLKDTLHEHLTSSISKLVVGAVSQTLTETIPVMLERALPPILILKLGRTVTHTVTRALSHSLASSLTFTMKQSMLVEPYCYYCKHGDKSYCHVCHKRESEAYSDAYYLDWFVSFYSDYYADQFAGGRFKGAGEGEGEAG